MSLAPSSRLPLRRASSGSPKTCSVAANLAACSPSIRVQRASNASRRHGRPRGVNSAGGLHRRARCHARSRPIVLSSDVPPSKGCRATRALFAAGPTFLPLRAWISSLVRSAGSSRTNWIAAASGPTKEPPAEMPECFDENRPVEESVAGFARGLGEEQTGMAGGAVQSCVTAEFACTAKRILRA